MKQTHKKLKERTFDDNTMFIFTIIFATTVFLLSGIICLIIRNIPSLENKTAFKFLAAIISSLLIVSPTAFILSLKIFGWLRLQADRKENRKRKKLRENNSEGFKRPCKETFGAE